MHAIANSHNNNFHAGLIAAPYTPFDRKGKLNLSVIPGYAEYLLRSGVKGVFVCGTTGEGASLTPEECRQSVRAWVDAAAGRMPVFVNLGQTAFENAAQLAAFAAAEGASAVAALAPYYYKPSGVEVLAQWCTALAGAAGGLPFYYYHIPSMTGVDVRVRELMELLAARIPNFAGVKYTHEDLEDYRACVAFGGRRFDVLFGRDELLLEGVRCGARGAVGSTYNYAAALYNGIFEALAQGDCAEAERRQALAVEMIRICCGAGVTHLAATKALMLPLTGIDCGPVRLPLIAAAPERIELLLLELETLGVLDEIRVG